MQGTKTSINVRMAYHRARLKSLNIEHTFIAQSSIFDDQAIGNIYAVMMIFRHKPFESAALPDRTREN